MGTIFVDGDACPVRDEVYRVARRYSVRVVIVAKTPLWVPSDTQMELTLCPGFGAVDDWIAEQVGTGDIVVTADIPLAARCLAKGAYVLDPKGCPFTDNEIGTALATRDLLAGLRQGGAITGGPAPMTAKDRSRFLSKLNEAVNAKSRADHPRP